jgi:acyl-CoA-binding protein
MSDLDVRFDQATQDATQLSKKPNNLTMLRLYALYKQASAGDVQGERPGMGDFIGKYKFDAWESLKGMSVDDAKTQYVELVESLKSGAGA